MGSRLHTAAAICALAALVSCAAADAPEAPRTTTPSAPISDPPDTEQAAPAEESEVRPRTEKPQPSPKPQRASDASEDPDSIHVLVNRQNPLEPVDYEPTDLVEPPVRTSVEHGLYLREEPAQALAELFAHAMEEGVSLAMTSAYRSFELQADVYAARHVEYGTEATDEFAARPGYSEHQTGLAADVISIDNAECIHGGCFAQTAEGRWVAAHAHHHGFIIRYPEGEEDITGYQYEPWHLRYVGEATATEVFDTELTLEEYWGLDPAPNYDEDEPALQQHPPQPMVRLH